MGLIECIAQTSPGPQGQPIPWYTEWQWITGGIGAVLAAIITAWALLRKKSDPAPAPVMTQTQTASPHLEQHTHIGHDEAKTGEILESRLEPVRAELEQIKQLLAPKQVVKPSDSEIRQRAKELFNKGYDAAVAGDLPAARAYFDSVIHLGVNDADAYYNRGLAKSELGDERGAIADYDEAIRLNPNYAMAYNNRGNSKSVLGDKRGAISDFTEAIRTNPNHVKAYYNRGTLMARDLGDEKGAVSDFTDAIRLDPNYAMAYYNRGIARKKLGDKHGAIADRAEAVRLDPSLADRT